MVKLELTCLHSPRSAGSILLEKIRWLKVSLLHIMTNIQENVYMKQFIRRYAVTSMPWLAQLHILRGIVGKLE